jgi:hypothetical protein
MSIPPEVLAAISSAAALVGHEFLKEPWARTGRVRG